MPRTDSTDAILALLMGFILSAGIAAIVLSRTASRCQPSG